MGAYQGQSISFLYDGNKFQIVRFPQYDEKLVYPYTHSNFADWVNGTLMIHNRSQGYLYECGSTQYYSFEKDTFKLTKQVIIECSENELEEIQKGKLSPDDLEMREVYPK
jgi:hypothetical protein